MLSLIVFLVTGLALGASTPWATSHSRGEILNKTRFIINYNEDHEVPNWVEYSLARKNLKNCTTRTNNFRIDPHVSTGSATLEDYRGSGFDRGHIIPAADMKESKLYMSETFFMSNMTPQPPRFNRVYWNQLEALIRAWAYKYEDIKIITGPILTPKLPTIGNRNRVSVPNEYFKAILRKEKEGYKGIAFLIPTTTPYKDLSLYTISIRDLEQYSDINFFKFLSKSDSEIEETLNTNDWDFSARFEYLPCSLAGAL